jgi:hypothetical protein
LTPDAPRPDRRRQEQIGPKGSCDLAISPRGADLIAQRGPYPGFLMAPFERFFDPRRVGRPSTPRTNRNLGESVITKRIDADRKLGLKGPVGGAATQWSA